MHGRIELLGNYYDVMVYGRSPNQLVQIDDSPPEITILELKNSGDCEIQMGQNRTKACMHVKGETAYIRAFGQTFTLKVVNPVEQASMGTSGSSRKARAPMPGVVVDIHVTEGEGIVKGQLVVTIESMKILTAIPAPSDGKIEKIHFKTGQPFEKGAVLVTLCQEDK